MPYRIGHEARTTMAARRAAHNAPHVEPPKARHTPGKPVTQADKPEHPTPDFLRHLLGLRYEDAVQNVKASGRRYRITRKDGFYLIVTMDLDAERVNLSLRDGKVVAAYTG